MSAPPAATVLIALTPEQQHALSVLPALLERLSALVGNVQPSEKRVRFLSVPQLMAEFNVGRRQALRLIERGELPASRRTARGGREAWAIDRKDAERVLGGHR
jgi:hypothetical protein